MTQYLKICLYSIFVPMLDNDDFFVRDYATHILNENRSPLIFLYKIDNLEGKTRLRQLQDNTRCEIAERWFQQNKNTAPWAKQGHPSIGYLSSPLNNAKDDNIKEKWPRWRLATALYLRDYISETLDFDGVQATLNELSKTEKLYKEQQKKIKQQRLVPDDY